MKNKKMKARVTFQERDGREGFAIEIFTDNAWGLDTWFPCVAKIGAEAVGAENETDYIHWRILRKISEMQNAGYDIEFDC